MGCGQSTRPKLPGETGTLGFIEPYIIEDRKLPKVVLDGLEKMLYGNCAGTTPGMKLLEKGLGTSSKLTTCREAPETTRVASVELTEKMFSRKPKVNPQLQGVLVQRGV
mmetsp:Transcript_11167/g.21968  ORF Transcript_11167/g.21968 Transcript_11167/m.21968 type:complete len:109 (-) Transcript_11167:532-858(-)